MSQELHPRLREAIESLFGPIELRNGEYPDDITARYSTYKVRVLGLNAYVIPCTDNSSRQVVFLHIPGEEVGLAGNYQYLHVASFTWMKHVDRVYVLLSNIHRVLIDTRSGGINYADECLYDIIL